MSILDEMVFQAAVEGGNIQAVTPGASPYTYTAKQSGALSIQGGTVSLASLSRNGVSVTLGLVSGLISLSSGDSVTITYVVAPTINFIPR